jgi:hypothetical protein
MQKLRVVEGYSEWRVEFDGKVIFASPSEERCFTQAIETSSKLFDDGVKTTIELERFSWDVTESPRQR